MGLEPKEIAVVGDQIFTDVWGGNRCGMVSVLVPQTGPDNTFFLKVKRPLEKIVLKSYRKYINKRDK